MSSETALEIFDRRESKVRGYIRSFPTCSTVPPAPPS